jgi:raffinose/stachyose/melibiose transport system substrate-binding protein
MRQIYYLLVLMVAALVLAACLAPIAQPGAPAAPGTAAPAAEQQVTLRVMDTFTAGTQAEGVDRLYAMFEERHPNINIERETMITDEMRTIVQTSLASGTGPDIIYYDTGTGFAGVLARAGLLLPLDDAYNEFGWNDRIFGWTKERTSFGDRVYGIGHELEFIGAYYNQDLFEEHGVQPPQTYEELLALCNTFNEAGIIPIAFADGPKWPAYHAFSLAANNVAGKEKLDNILFGDGRWDDPEIVRAIQIWFEEMRDHNCFIPDTAAISYGDGNALFYNGQAAMHFTGTWLLSGVLENSQFPVGWFFFPSVDGGEVLPPAGLGSGYFISAATQHPEEAALFLDFLFSEEAAQVWMEEVGVIPPIDFDAENYDLPELLQFAVEALQTTEMGHNIDVLTPDTFNTMMGDGFQAMLLGEKSAEEMAADLQRVWEEAIAEGKVER